MTPSRDPLELHPLSVFATLAAGRHAASAAAVDAEPDPDPERASVHRRLLAVLGRRLEPDTARRGADVPTL